MDEMPLIERPRSANAYGFGFRSSVTPLSEPESPPPPRPDGKRIPSGVLRGRNAFSGPVLPREMNVTDPCPSTYPLIPTISVDSMGDDDHELPFPRKSFHQSMLSTCSQGPCSDYSSLEATDRMQFVSTRIHQLVTAFTHRALNIKERIAQPPTPSTDSSDRGGERAPDPPPLKSRPSLDDGLVEEVIIKEPLSWRKLIQKFQLPRAVDPQGWSYIIWLVVVSFCFNYNAWSIPLRATFPYQTDANVATWLTVDYCCDFIYVVDIFFVLPRLKFLRDGFWIDDPAEMRRNYWQRRNFKVDLVSLMPLDLFYFYFGLHTPLLRLPRVLRISNFWELFDRLDVLLASAFLVRVGRTFLYMMYLIHVDASVYYYFSLVEGIGSTPFVYQGQGNAYLRCFYFAMKTVTKIGKNAKPVNDTENLFMIFNWLIGVFACAAIIGQLHDIMAAAEQHEAEYREKLDKTVNFMNRLNLPRNIQDRVRLWFTFSWSQQKTLNENAALFKLPRKLHADIALNVHMQTLSKVQLFQDCDKALLRDLVLKLKPVLFLPGDLVCKKGEVGKEMYIVKTGQVQVMGGPKNEIVLVTLSEGSVFGEISLLAIGGGNRRLADVRSKGFSNLFVLSKADLNEAIKDYPEAQKVLQRKAKKLIKQNAARNKSLTNEDEQIPIINNRPETPRLLKTVLQTVDPNSKTAQLLLYGSRVNLLPRMVDHTSTLSLTQQDSLNPSSSSIMVRPFQSDSHREQVCHNCETNDDELTVHVEVNHISENDCTTVNSPTEMIELENLTPRSGGSLQRQNHVLSQGSEDSLNTFELLEEKYHCTSGFQHQRSWFGGKAVEDLDHAFSEYAESNHDEVLSLTTDFSPKSEELLLNPRSFQTATEDVLRRNYFKPLFNSKVAPLPP